MKPSSATDMARAVLARYPPPVCGGTAFPLGNAGGFSGALLWRVETPGGCLCLRAWPPGSADGDRLREIHAWMAHARTAGLSFVPRVWAARTGCTWTAAGGRRWDVSSWMPGEPDGGARPSRARLEGACTALARLHHAWAGLLASAGPCPAVRRRLDRARDWSALVAAGWDPLTRAAPDDPVRPLAQRAWPLLRGHMESTFRRLVPWADRRVPLQPCLCDVWRAHVLFRGDEVSGVIDYGSARVDHVAADLARLLGGLAGDDPQARAWGSEAYARVRPLSGEDESLAVLLDATGALLGAANWLMWLYHEGRTFQDRTAVARRFGELVDRIAAWERGGQFRRPDHYAGLRKRLFA